MKSFLNFTDKVQDQNGVGQPIWDCAFHPSGKEMLVTAGSEILVYTLDGEMIQSLKSHKDVVYTLDYSQDGKYFASGGADKNVVIWNASTKEGILKYSHNDSIQIVSHNPITNQVLSCTASEFGLWTFEQKNVVKTRVSTSNVGFFQNTNCLLVK